MAVDQSAFRSHRVFLVLTVAAFAAAAAVWFGFPHEKELPSLWVLLVKLIPFVLAVEAIAAMDLAEVVRRRIALAAIPVCFLVFFTYFVPKIFFGEGVYYLILTLTPFLILSFVLAYRLGGGTGGTVRRLGYACLLLQLSGLEDLAFLTINPHTDPKWTPIPEVWSWADHMTVRVGHELTKNEAFVFIGVHVVLAVLVLTLPDRFWRRLLPRRAPRAERRPEPETVGASG
ncbi:hypothetical protein ACTG9Q_14370 [Actinokineospora sp. 24-640]